MQNFLLMVFFVLKIRATSATLLDYLPRPCSKSVLNYNECATKYLTRIGSRLFNGIPELNIPSFNPFRLSSYAVNSSISDILGIKTIIKEYELWNLGNIEIKKLKLNTEELGGEIHYYFPNLIAKFNYDANIHLLSPDVLRNKGFLMENATDVNVRYKYNFKVIEQNKKKYYAVDNMTVKLGIGSVQIKTTSENPNTQFVANIIQDFFNKNPNRLLDPFMPTIEENIGKISKFTTDRILGAIPAEEILPP